MEWSAAVDLYCERLGPGLRGEPLNALSNLAFLAAAAAVLTTLRQRGRRDRAVAALAWLVAAIGIGSFLFHTVADRRTMLADVVPITLFIYAYLALVLDRFLGLGRAAIIAGLLAFLVLAAAVEALLRPLVAGSAAYAPALLALLGLGTLLARRRQPAGAALLAGAALFLLSLTLRTLDLPLCEHFPSGTHFLWHILNAVLLAFLLVAAFGCQKAPQQQGGRR